jgi:Ala-tRNA(Pro) deacylase
MSRLFAKTLWAHQCERRINMDIAEFLSIRECWYEHMPHEPTYSAQRLAHKLHVPGREVAKTVLLRVNPGTSPAFFVAVLPANKSVDFERAARVVRGKNVELATEIEIAAHCPDCDFGVLPPFGSRYGMRTIVDSSLAEDEEIWFEGNTHKEAIRMKFDDFRRLEQPTIAAIAADD